MGFLRFEQEDETRAVAKVLADIGRTFASDKFDRTNGFATSQFMIWREEQKAIGEVSIDPDSDWATPMHRLCNLRRGI